MNYAVKAYTTSKYRRNNTIFMGICMAVILVGIAMIVYSIATASWLFVASYLIALILLFTYVMIKYNAVYVTFLATDKTNLIMKNWSNNFLPYDVDNKIKILSEFVPARTKIIEIPVSEIEKIIIGTKNFIKRNVSGDDEFISDVKPYETSKDYYKKRNITSMDIFYVKLVDNQSFYMPIMNFNSKNVMKILNVVLKANEEIELVLGSREYRKFKRTEE